MHIILLVVLWGILSVMIFTQTRGHVADTRCTAAFIGLYPVLAVALFLNDPVPKWLAVPAVFAFLPWLMAGPHLWRSLKDPAAVKANELMGIPRLYWLLGGVVSIVLGILFK